MYVDSTSSVKSILYELGACWEVLEEILVVHIIDLYSLVLVIFKKNRIQWKSQNGQYMGDAAFLQSFLAP